MTPFWLAAAVALPLCQGVTTGVGVVVRHNPIVDGVVCRPAADSACHAVVCVDSMKRTIDGGDFDDPDGEAAYGLSMSGFEKEAPGP